MFPSLVCVTLTCLLSVSGYKIYQEQIPNADHVPHPCKPNLVWHGLGHKNSQGGGEKNPFGLDFLSNGKKWDETLCRKDSDGDGQTNGQELGDPDCRWRPGNLPARTQGISHPGICEPLDDPKCVSRNNWDFCSNAEFTCDYVKSPGVRNITLKLDHVKVPAQKTTYMCQIFDLPRDQEYHVIATQPHIDNAYVMHHMSYFGCDVLTGGGQYENATECGMPVSSAGCSSVFGFWTLGSWGDCHNPLAGFRMGPRGMKRIVLEFHWTNPQEHDHYVDSSGVTLYYTPILRPNDASFMLVGQMHLAIPPHRADVMTYQAACTSKCTSNFLPKPIYVFNTNIHMHYLGVSGRFEHIRNGRSLDDLAYDEVYNYDSPVFHTYNSNPVEIKPGDELRVTCQFTSRYRENVTFYGQGTTDEMCFAFFSYYPKQTGLQMCLDYNQLDTCEARLPENGGRNGGMQMVGGCNTTGFYTSKEGYMLMRNIAANCTEYKIKCTDNCKAAIQYVKERNSCFRGDVSFMLLQNIALFSKEAKVYQSIMRKCDEEHWPDLGVGGAPETSLHPLVWCVLTFGLSLSIL